MAFVEIKHWNYDNLFVLDISTEGVQEFVDTVIEKSFDTKTKELALDHPITPSEGEFKEILNRASKSCETGETFEPVYVGENVKTGYYLTGRLPEYNDGGIKPGDYLWYDGNHSQVYTYAPVIIRWCGESRDGMLLVTDENGHDAMIKYSDDWYIVKESIATTTSSELYRKIYNGNDIDAVNEIIRLKRKCGELIDGPVED